MLYIINIKIFKYLGTLDVTSTSLPQCNILLFGLFHNVDILGLFHENCITMFFWNLLSSVLGTWKQKKEEDQNHILDAWELYTCIHVVFMRTATTLLEVAPQKDC